MPRDLFNGPRHVAKFARAIGAQGAHVFGGSHRTMHYGALACLKLEIQPHRFQRQQQIGKDNRCVHAQLLRGSDGHLSGQLRVLANLHQRVMLAHVAVFLHVAAGLPQKPNWRAVHRLAQACTNKTAAVEDRFGCP